MSSFDRFDNERPPTKKGRLDLRGQLTSLMVEEELGRVDETIRPNKIVLLTVLNANYPITVEIVYKVCSPHGRVVRIVIFEKAIIQAMVEFENIDEATEARHQLHGCDIYSGCCTLKVEFAKTDKLNVRKNDNKTWDFTEDFKYNPGQNDQRMNRPVLLTEPPASGGLPMRGNVGRSNYPRPGVSRMHGSAGHWTHRRPHEMVPGQHRNWDQGNQFNNGMGRMVGQHQVGNFRMADGGRGHQPMGRGMPQGMMPGRMGQGVNQWGHDMQGDFMGGGGACHGPVVMVYGLDTQKMSCQALFNLFCQYGNVRKVMFMKNKEGSGMVEMSDPEAAERVIYNMDQMELFGSKLKLDISKKVVSSSDHTFYDCKIFCLFTSVKLS